MKLAIFLRAPEVWGAEKSLLTLLGSKAATDHVIDVYIGPGSPLSVELEKRGMSWSTFDFVRHASLSDGGLRKASPRALVWDLARITKQAFKARGLVSNYDAVLTFGLWETAEIALAGKLSKTPVLFDFHVTFSGRAGRAALKGITSLVRGVIAPSVATYRQAGINPTSNRLQVVPRPVSIPPLSESNELSKHKLKVGIFGQIDDRKGILEVVATLSPLVEVVTLTVVGARPQDARTAYENDVLDAVQAVGHDWQVLERTDAIGELMWECDVVLNMSRHEAFGRTIVEAAGVGALPVVMSGGGPEEIVKDMGHGVVVSSWDELAATISSLSSTFRSGQSVRLSRRQIEQTHANYSPELIGRRYFDEIEGLAGIGTRAS